MNRQAAVLAGTAYCAVELITVAVTFSEKVTSNGNLKLDLDIGGVTQQAALEIAPESTFRDSLTLT